MKMATMQQRMHRVEGVVRQPRRFTRVHWIDWSSHSDSDSDSDSDASEASDVSDDTSDAKQDESGGKDEA